MFEISKSFTFSMAHSVFSQSIDSRLAKGKTPKCRRLPGHGHNYTLVVYLSAGSLDRSQMVTDFAHLDWLKTFISDYLDHRTMLSFQDPATEVFLEKMELLREGTFSLPFDAPPLTVLTVDKSYRMSDLSFRQVSFSFLSSFRLVALKWQKERASAIQDFYDRLLNGLVFFEHSPTSENLASFFYHLTAEVFKPLNIRCSKVSVYETQSSCATFGER